MLGKHKINVKNGDFRAKMRIFAKKCKNTRTNREFDQGNGQKVDFTI